MNIYEPIGRMALEASLRPQREFGRFCKAADGRLEFPVSVSAPTIDEKRMAVGPVRISTPVIDRDGDILVPTGIRLENYERNPIVYWDHSFSGEDGGTLPIATSRHPDGSLAVEADDEAVKAISYFHGETMLSNQVFRLIVKGAINAASVRPEPISTRLVQNQETGDTYLVMDEWGLAEWSWCGVGVNQEALFKAVRDNRIDGERLAVPLVKSFGPLVPPAKVQIRKTETVAAVLEQVERKTLECIDSLCDRLRNTKHEKESSHARTTVT